MNVYHGKTLNVKHFDLYRINWPEELEDIGFSEYAGGDGVTFIEWAELFPDAMPEENLELKLTREGRRTARWNCSLTANHMKSWSGPCWPEGPGRLKSC